jgi:hypothetical protein
MLVAVVVAAEVTRHFLLPEAPAVLAEVQTEVKAQLDQTQLQIQVVVAAAADIVAQDLMVAPAAPALSSCRMQCQSARPLFSNPQQRGLHRPAQRRWITLS